MTKTNQLLAVGLAALSLCTGAAQANSRQGGFVGAGAAFRGHHGGFVATGPAFRSQAGWGHGHWRGGRFWGGVNIGFGVPFYYYPYASPWYGGTVLVAPPPVVYAESPQMPVPAAKAPPDPIFYPRNDQSPAQTEADRQACNRWATTQQSAMSDASVFHRATMACMEGRGYTVR